MARRFPLPCRLTLLVGALATTACTAPDSRGGGSLPPAAFAAFPDFGHMLPTADFDTISAPVPPVFDLKHDYPPSSPPASQFPAALDIDFTTDWLAYLDSVKSYCFDGNLPEWNPFDNDIRGWYHIPWLHPTPEGYPPYGGTEGFRGVIKEAEVSPRQLAATQDSTYQVYAITLINEFAGYTLGQMWRDPENPDPRTLDRRWGGGFPVGSVFCKLLFTDAPRWDDEVPFLENPLQWNVYITERWDSPQRAVLPVNLLQMDIMVRDDRPSAPMGWVFGTYAYNGALNNANKFDNLVPLGLQWGNDPTVTDNIFNPLPPTETITNPDLRETVINTSPDLPPQHLGWGRRLNGPADLNTSACMSCHAAAEFPNATALVPPGAVPSGPTPPPRGGSPEWMQWFQNIPAATPRNSETYSTDFSLQIAISLENFWAAKNAAAQGYWASQYRLPKHPIAR